MPLLAPQAVSLTGLTPTYSPAAASTTVPCGDRLFLHVKNTAGSSMTVTLTSTAKVAGQPAADVVVTVPATTGDKMIGPILAGLLAGGTDGSCAVTYSSTASVTVALLRI
ncbi:hypothetical protein ACIQOW_03710 [Kitasatospora sp. NPDC091335]|uniref:hypothetical protein n=1 Tax=Kitasatospora sp. NPDC091335 TaxID=3364085 RepID=UPI00380AC8DD